MKLIRNIARFMSANLGPIPYEKALFDAGHIPEDERSEILDAAQEAFRHTFLEELAMRSNNAEIGDIKDLKNKEEK